MPTAKKEKTINLLPQNAFEASTVGRVLTWALSTFRIIVIITEMAVMGAFLSRFWLDAKNSDLNETIKEKTAIVSSTSDFEKEFRLLQKKIEVFAKTADQNQAPELFKTVASYLPAGVILTNLSLDGEGLQIKGTAVSEQFLAQFMTNLESANKFKEVTLSQIASSQEGETLITFTLTITLKER